MVLGALFGILFGAVSVYVGLRAGLTVSASIPIAVLSISILRAFGRSTILENNIVQTTGSAGESVAAGVIFTIPALIFLGYSLNTEYWRIFFLALLGGWLGVLFMIPLRRQLIVKEHGNLTFPEGTACADVLVAGERGGSFAGRVFWGLGLGGVYTFCMNTLGMWPGQPEYQPAWLPGASFRAAITSEYLGVGYIIGPRVAGTLFAGGVISWLVLMPAIRFFGSLAPNAALYPSTVPIPQMTPDQLWASYIRPMGAGAVAASGLITLIKTMPTIFAALTAGIERCSRQASRRCRQREPHRTRPFHARRLVGSVVIRRHDVGAAEVQADSRRADRRFRQSDRRGFRGGLRIFVRYGRVANQRPDRQLVESGERHDHRHADGHMRDVSRRRLDRQRLCRARAHDWRRRLHRFGDCGRHVAGLEDRLSWSARRPIWQQIGLVIGVMVSSFAIGGTLILMNVGLAQYRPMQIALDIDQSSRRASRHQQENYVYDGKTYVLVNAHRLERNSRRKISLRSRHAPDRNSVGAGNRQREGRRAASAPDGDRDQRHPESAASVAAGLSRRVSGDRRRAAGHSFAAVRGRLLHLDCDDDGHVRRRHGALARRARHGRKKRRGERSEPRLALRQRIDRGGRRLRPARHHHQPVAGPRAQQARSRAGSAAHLPLPWPANMFAFGDRFLPRLSQAPLLGVVLFVLLAVSLFISARKKLN